MSSSPAVDHVASALAALERHGLLLLQDAKRPSLATLVAGAPVHGSWWSHASGKSIYATAEALDDAGVATTAKLIDGKVTFVHRRLWPALVAIGRAREPWQLDALPTAARELLERIDKDGNARASGASAKALEQRLLVSSAQLHTETGAHALELRTWDRFASEMDLRPPWRSAAEGRAAFERALAALPGGDATSGLPWLAKAAGSPAK
jgi:hypothetical protein